MTRRPGTTTMLVAFGALLAAAALAAQGLPKLPEGLALPRSADSPGQVIFNHVSHVDEARPDCTTCHPRLFSILEAAPGTAHAPILHAKMDKGQQCGACHDGKKAFSMADDCTMCHQATAN